MQSGTARRKSPNPLFEKWLMEWRDQAKDKHVEGNLTRALKCLKKYPLPLKSGRECIVIQNFGPKLCQMLEKKLTKHREMAISNSNGNDGRTCEDFPLGKKNVSEKSTNRLSGESRKRIHSMSSSDSSDVPLRIIANQAETLHSNGAKRTELPSKKPTKSSKGKTKASQEKTNKKSPSESSEKNESNESSCSSFEIGANEFDVVLLVDTHETKKSNSKDDPTQLELRRCETRFEIRQLSVGDFAWVAKCRKSGKELVLPYIVERKRIDDLASSIKDGRFHEQKFRLQKSGIRNLIYMVEQYGNNKNIGLPARSLDQAVINSFVQDGFMIKETDGHQDSMQYLSMLTNLIEKTYHNQHLVSCGNEITDNANFLMEFETFNKSTSKIKTFKVKEMFIRQLLQLKGLSLDKVLAIVELYQTPMLLKSACRSSGVNFLASLRVGSSQRQLGPAMSKTIHDLYTK